MNNYKIKLNDQTVVNVVFVDNKYTGCCFIQCIGKLIGCKECNIQKQSLNGKMLTLEDIKDLIVQEEINEEVSN